MESNPRPKSEAMVRLCFPQLYSAPSPEPSAHSPFSLIPTPVLAGQATEHWGPASKRCRMNVAAAILVIDASPRLHHDCYNFFRLPWLPSDTCFRLRTSCLSARFLKSFSLCCFFTGIIYFPHHNFWKYVIKKTLRAICRNYSSPCLKKSTLGENDKYYKSCENGHLWFLTKLC